MVADWEAEVIEPPMRFLQRGAVFVFQLVLAATFGAWPSGATILGSVRGVVHDPDHRPVAGAEVALRASSSQYSQTVTTGDEGAFEFSLVPLGRYLLTVAHDGFAVLEQPAVLAHPGKSRPDANEKVSQPRGPLRWGELPELRRHRAESASKGRAWVGS